MKYVTSNVQPGVGCSQEDWPESKLVELFSAVPSNWLKWKWLSVKLFGFLETYLSPAHHLPFSECSRNKNPASHSTNAMWLWVIPLRLCFPVCLIVFINIQIEQRKFVFTSVSMSIVCSQTVTSSNCIWLMVIREGNSLQKDESGVVFGIP